MFVDSAYRKMIQDEMCNTLDSLRERLDVPVLLKSYFARHFHSDSFACIKSQYIDIFSNIIDICVDSLQVLDPTEASPQHPGNPTLRHPALGTICQGHPAPTAAGLQHGKLRACRRRG